jgi:hypothetical protein
MAAASGLCLLASAVAASPASAACGSVVLFEERIYFGNHEPKLKVGGPIGEGTRPDGCNDTVEVVDGVTVAQPPVPLRAVVVRGVVGKSPAVAVAVEGDADTVFLYARRVPGAEAAAASGRGGFVRAALLGLTLVLLAGGALAIWRFARRNTNLFLAGGLERSGASDSALAEPGPRGTPEGIEIRATPGGSFADPYSFPPGCSLPSLSSPASGSIYVSCSVRGSAM